MAILSEISKINKIRYFFGNVPKDAMILEVGSGDGWLGHYLKSNGWNNYLGIDLKAPADVVGDIKNWRNLGLKPASFDVITAFEVVEHIDCFKECADLLKPNGLLFLTSPIPSRDWICKILEFLGLTQKRTSPHDHLIDFKEIPYFKSVEIKYLGPTAQWGKFVKDSTLVDA